MKNSTLRLVTLGAVGFAGLLAGAPEGRSAPAPADAHRETLDQFRAEYPRMLMRGDGVPHLPLASDDIRLMPAYQWTVLGKANAEAYYRAFVTRFQLREFRRELGEVADFAQRVGEYGRFTQTLVHRHSGKEYSIAGKYLDLWSKSADGALQLVTQVWNYDEPLDFGDLLLFPDIAAVRTAFAAHVPVKGGISFELAALNCLHGIAITQHDAAVWSQFFADDAVLLPNYDRIRRGRDDIEDYIAAHAQHLPVFEKLDIRNDRIDDLGAYVVEYASHVANWRAGDSSGVNTGKNIRIWRREPSGALRYFWQMGNYDG